MAFFELGARLILGLFLVGCRGKGPEADGLAGAASPATGEPATAGATIRAEHYLIRASAPLDCSPPGRDPSSTRRVGVELWLEPSGDLQVPANPYYARLVDERGDVYEATLGGCGPALAPSLPRRGTPARGFVVFEVPRSARDFTLLYAPELVSAAKSELAIELGR